GGTAVEILGRDGGLLDLVGEGFESLLARLGRQRLLLRFEGEVELLEPTEQQRLEVLLAVLVGGLPLRFERADDRPLALLELTQFQDCRANALYSLLVEPTGLVTPVARDEGDGVPSVEQLDGTAHRIDRQLHLPSNLIEINL